MIKSREKFQEELNNRFPQNKVKIIEYSKASGPIVYECLECGKIYKKSRANHLYENKTLCPICYSGRTSNCREWFFQQMDGKNFLLLDETPNHAINKPFKIKCLKCQNIYYYKIQQREKSNKLTCRFCGMNGYPVVKEEFLRRYSNEMKDFKILDYKNMTSSMKLQHSCGYVFSKMPFNFIKVPHCPKCKPKRSSGEQKIFEYLSQYNVSFEEQKKFSELGNLSFDFFLPKLKILIEYQGAQHYAPISHFGGKEKFLIQQQNDRIKKDFANKKGYFLLEIPYYDYSNIEKILEGSTTILNGVDKDENKNI